MTKLVNRAKMTTATTGTGTITLGSAVDGYQTFADAGVANADIVRYVIEDGDAWEIGLGTYSSGTLTRGSIESSNADAALNLTGDAVVYVSAAAADLQELVDFSDNFVLPTADGSTGQVLTTNGAGTLSFSTIEGYTDADVDTHLNTSTAASGEVLSWTGSDYDWITAGGSFSTIGTRNLAALTTLPDLTTGTDNFVAGNLAGDNLTSGSNNVAIGNGALDAATTGGRNIAIGQDAMGAGIATAITGNNIAMGFQAGNSITTGTSNVMLGPNTGRFLTTGSLNVVIGSTAFSSATTATSIVAVGMNALANCLGDNNTALGRNAGLSLSSGVNNTIIGYNSEASSATVSNEITLGNSSIATLRCQVTTITSLSDARDKADIQPLNAGLEFVEALNPVSFTWNMRDGGKVGEADTGFIAQDLQTAQADTGVTIPGLVFDANPEKLEAGYGKLIPVLVQAIKDLSAEVKELKAQLETK